jgi:8-oxo-dGTP pyrophosphatase MutT (NUDIX family)
MQFKSTSKVTDLSSCVVMVREARTTANNYEILLLKRTQNLAFGGYYAFPGGKLDKQDHIEAY